MNGTKRFSLTILVVVTLIGCDQATKSMATRSLGGNEAVGVVGEFFRLEYTENSGAMLGVGAEFPDQVRFWLFTVFAGCALLGILAFTVVSKKLRIVDIISLSFVLGGGMGNLIDRLFKGGIVIDFMVITAGSFRTAIFNFADLSIIFGLLLLGIANLPSFPKSQNAIKNS